MLVRRVLAVALAVGAMAGAASVGQTVASGDEPSGAGVVGPDAAERTRLVAEEQERQEDFRAYRASDAAREARARSRGSFVGLGRVEAVELARDRFPGVLSEPLYPRLDLGSGDRLLGFASDYEARIERTDGQRLVARAVGLPLRSELGSGRKEPLDLALERSDAGFVPRNPLVAVSISDAGLVRLRDSGVGIRMAGPSAQLAAAGNDRLFAAEVAEDTDLVVAPTALGARLAWQVRSPAAPEQATLEFDLPPGASIREAAGGAVDVVAADGKTLARLMPPAAWDAEGVAIEASYELVDGRVTVRFPHRGKDLLYPLIVDPDVAQPFGGFVASGDPWTKYANFPTYFQLTSSDGALKIASATGTFETSYYGQWSWTASWEWMIVRADFTGLWFSPGATNMCMRVGIWHQSTGVDGHMTHCGSSLAGASATVGTPAGVRGANALVFSMFPNAAGVRSQSATLSMYGAVAYMRDARPPSEPAVTAPTGWIRPEDATLTVSATDSPTGVSHFALRRQGSQIVLDYGGTPCDTDCPATKTATVTWPAADLNDGANIAEITAYDGHGNPSPPQLTTLTVDQDAPDIDPGGSLWDASDAGSSYTELELPGVYPLTVEATDQQSKMSRVAVYVDGELKHDTTAGAGGTSMPLNWDFTVAESEPGEHELEIKAWDQLGRVSVKRARIKVAVRGWVPKMGVNLRPWDGIPTSALESTLGSWFQRLHGAGIRYARVFFNYRKWKLEPSDKPETTAVDEKFQRWDTLMRVASDYGVQILPILGNETLQSDATPGVWKVPSDNGDPLERGSNYHGPTRNEWEAFVYNFALRYKAGEDGRPLSRSAQAWEVWNEPNLAGFFEDRPEADYYADVVLDAASREIKRANNRARVVMGGLAVPSDAETKNYLDEVLNGLNTFSNYIFDVVSVHPYWENTDKLSGTLTTLRASLHGLPQKKQIWVTEFGWSDQAKSPFHDDLSNGDDPNVPNEIGDRYRADSERAQASKVSNYLDFIQQSSQRDREDYRTGPQFLFPEQGNEHFYVNGQAQSLCNDRFRWYCYSGLWKMSTDASGNPAPWGVNGAPRKMLTSGTDGPFTWTGFSDRARCCRLNYPLPDAFGGSGWGS